MTEDSSDPLLLAPDHSLLLRGIDVVHHNIAEEVIADELRGIAAEEVLTSVEVDGILLTCSTASGKAVLLDKATVTVWGKEFVMLDISHHGGAE
eukprot:NODE_23523_length_662_cov_8.846729.p1 GENE.NODE_23523_length_662_cov_8.846729~~NODE_23523_length_662_cov_8.846729.p1  ORF type:complete len:94 (-),score=25.96 NODE_23523_length_662_cov_8.846729:320-601(-)